jgi:hypothetical protein
MNNLIVKKSQVVEAIINGTPTTGVRYFFTQIPNLSANNCRLYGLESFSTTQLAISPTGYTVVSTTTGIIVTLRNTKKEEFLYQMPYYTLIRANNFGAYVIISPQTINLTDCYIVLTATTGLSASNSAAFNFYYDLI